MTTRSKRSVLLTAALGGLLYSSFPGMAATAPVDLGSAARFAILSESGITDVSPSDIVGDVGTSPITGAAITATDANICDEVVGTIYTVDAAGPACSVAAPAFLDTAVGDMMIAYADAAARARSRQLRAGNGSPAAPAILPPPATRTRA